MRLTHRLFPQIKAIEIIAKHGPRQFRHIDVSVDDGRAAQKVVGSSQRILGQEWLFSSDSDKDASRDKSNEYQERRRATWSAGMGVGIEGRRLVGRGEQRGFRT
jgi:hypothetical protein